MSEVSKGATTKSPSLSQFMSTIVNCTPHNIDIFAADKKTPLISIPTSKYVARLAEIVNPTHAEFLLSPSQGKVVKIPLAKASTYGKVTGLPDNRDATIIVSQMVAKEMDGDKWQGQIFFPDMSSSGAVRSEKGQIIGTTRLLFFGFKND